MNTSDYGYSYANAVGFILRQPLYKVSDNVFAIIQNWHNDTFVVRIMKVAFRCLITAVCIVPSSLFWLLGKGIYLLGKTQIRKEGLATQPTDVGVLKRHSAEFQTIMTDIQNYKETLVNEILDPLYHHLFSPIPYFREGFLDDFKRRSGLELGLKKSKTRNALLPLTDPVPKKITNLYLKWVFREKIENTNRFISQIHLIIKTCPVQYYSFLFTSLPLPNNIKDEFIKKHFYTLNQGRLELTKEAVNFMLKTIGVLK